MSSFDERRGERRRAIEETASTSPHILSSFATSAAAAPRQAEEMDKVADDTYSQHESHERIRIVPCSFVKYSNLAGDMEVQGKGNEKDNGDAAAAASAADDARGHLKGGSVIVSLPWNHKEHGLLIPLSTAAREEYRDFQCLRKEETIAISSSTSFPALLAPVVGDPRDAAPEELKEVLHQRGRLVLPLEQQESKSVEGETVDGGTSTVIEGEEQEEVPQFLKKLTEILGSPCFEDIVHWSLDGDSFEVKDPIRMGQEVLPKFFRHGNFQSFVRQLNFYAFQRVSRERNSWIYHHELFKKDHPELLTGLKRTKTVNRRAVVGRATTRTTNTTRGPAAAPASGTPQYRYSCDDHYFHAAAAGTTTPSSMTTTTTASSSSPCFYATAHTSTSSPCLVSSSSPWPAPIKRTLSDPSCSPSSSFLCRSRSTSSPTTTSSYLHSSGGMVYVNAIEDEQDDGRQERQLLICKCTSARSCGSTGFVGHDIILEEEATAAGRVAFPASVPASYYGINCMLPTRPRAAAASTVVAGCHLRGGEEGQVLPQHGAVEQELKTFCLFPSSWSTPSGASPCLPKLMAAAPHTSAGVCLAARTRRMTPSPPLYDSFPVPSCDDMATSGRGLEAILASSKERGFPPIRHQRSFSEAPLVSLPPTPPPVAGRGLFKDRHHSYAPDIEATQHLESSLPWWWTGSSGGPSKRSRYDGHDYSSGCCNDAIGVPFLTGEAQPTPVASFYSSSPSFAFEERDAALRITPRTDGDHDACPARALAIVPDDDGWCRVGFASSKRNMSSQSSVPLRNKTKRRREDLVGGNEERMQQQEEYSLILTDKSGSAVSNSPTAVAAPSASSSPVLLNDCKNTLCPPGGRVIRTVVNNKKRGGFSYGDEEKRNCPAEQQEQTLPMIAWSMAAPAPFPSPLVPPPSSLSAGGDHCVRLDPPPLEKQRRRCRNHSSPSGASSTRSNADQRKMRKYHGRSTRGERRSVSSCAKTCEEDAKNDGSIANESSGDHSLTPASTMANIVSNETSMSPPRSQNNKQVTFAPDHIVIESGEVRPPLLASKNANDQQAPSSVTATTTAAPPAVSTPTTTSPQPLKKRILSTFQLLLGSAAGTTTTTQKEQGQEQLEESYWKKKVPGDASLSCSFLPSNVVVAKAEKKVVVVTENVERSGAHGGDMKIQDDESAVAQIPHDHHCPALPVTLCCSTCLPKLPLVYREDQSVDALLTFCLDTELLHSPRRSPNHNATSRGDGDGHEKKKNGDNDSQARSDCPVEDREVEGALLLMENDAEDRGTRRCRNEDQRSQQLQEGHDSRTTVAHHDLGGQQQQLKESSVALRNACKKLLQEFPSLGSRFCQYEEVGAVCDMCQRAVRTTLGTNALEGAEIQDNRCFRASPPSSRDEGATVVRSREAMVATVSFDSTSSLLSSSSSCSGDDEESNGTGSTASSYSPCTCRTRGKRLRADDEDWRCCAQKKERKLANGAGGLGGSMFLDKAQEQGLRRKEAAPEVHVDEERSTNTNFLSVFAAFAFAVLDVSFARMEYQCALVERARRLFALPSVKALTAAATGKGDDGEQLGQGFDLLQHDKGDHDGDYCSSLRSWRYLLLHRNAATTLQHMPAASV